jgi:hypothetical protein
MTIVSHGFKRQRIVDGHCTAIGWPLDRVDFVGIDPPGMAPMTGSVSVDLGKEDAIKGVAQAIGEWMVDPHGRGDSLRGKRKKRNPWGTWQGVFDKDKHEAREKSGLLITGQGDSETLVDAAERPWL